MRSTLLAKTLVAGSFLSAPAHGQTCTHDAGVATLGGGTAGIDGVPLLGFGGSPVVGRPFGMRVEHALPGSVCLFAAGASGAPVPLPSFGAVQHVLPPFFAFDLRAVDANGCAKGFLVQPSIGAAACGVEFFAQALVLDPDAQGQFAFTPAIHVEVGAARDDSNLFVEDARVGLERSILAHEFVDLDADGAIDVVALLATSDLVVHYGDGTGGVDAAVLLLPATGYGDLAVGNVGGSSDLDVVVLDELTGTVRTILGLGNRAFSAPTSVVWNAGHRRVRLADCNADGYDDLYVGGADTGFGGGATARMWYAVGDGTYFVVSDVGFITSGYRVVDEHFVDVDQDGFLDLVQVGRGSGSGVVRVLRNQAWTGGTFFLLALQSEQFFSGLPVGSELGDVTNDGGADLLVSNETTGAVELFDGGQAFQFPPSLTLPMGVAPGDPKVADVDGDAIVDLVVLDDSSNELLVRLGPTFSIVPAPIATTAHGVADLLELRDLDGDGALDAVFGSDDGWDLLVRRGNGDGTFAESVESAVAGSDFAEDVLVRDVDRDGIADLVTCQGGFDDRIGVQLGNGDGTFGAPLHVAVGDEPVALAIGDVNGDGTLDVVTANADEDRVAVAYGFGDGTFPVVRHRNVGDEPDAVAVGDLDGDGFDDVVAANAASGDVTVCFGRAGFGFDASVTLGAGTDPAVVRVVDLDADGALDVVVGDRTSGDVAVHLGNGDRTFASAPSHGFGGLQVRALAVADLDEDGALDLVVGGFVPFVGPRLAVSLGGGDGTFGAAVTTELFTTPQELRVADVNGDAILDVLVLTTGPLLMALGAGDGSLAAPVGFGTTNGASDLELVDVNGDGMRDAIVSSTNTGTDVLVMMNRLFE